ncbi:hypothetical protein GEO17_23930, partial [Escherichia coli]|nr:hypothetical protein [Escherichia coli]
RREVSALTDARKTLAYDFFRILRAPLVELGLEETAARRLLDVCYARSDAWEKENGGTIYVR